MWNMRTLEATIASVYTTRTFTAHMRDRSGAFGARNARGIERRAVAHAGMEAWRRVRRR